MMMEKGNLFVPNVIENLKIIHACKYICKYGSSNAVKVKEMYADLLSKY